MTHTLYVSLTSPFARLCRVVVREKGLSDLVSEAAVDPFADPADLIAANPAGQVPALARGDGGTTIIDSRLIAAWLDHLPSDAPSLLPAGGPERMAVRLAEAYASVMIDKGVARLLESRRPAEAQHAPTLARLTEQVTRAAAALPAQLEAQTQELSLGTILIGCALGHLDFRHPDIAWRSAHLELAAWYDAFNTRPSMAETRPDLA